jgi:excisionase family DNA binding protein
MYRPIDIFVAGEVNLIAPAKAKEKKMNRNLVGPKELAQYLDLSINTVYAWVNMRRIPFFKIGRLVKFDLREIDNWRDSMKVEVSDLHREV